MSGKELPAYYNSDNRLVMVACNESLRRLASDGSSQLPLALLGAIATVEEMIHFYQHTNLDRDMSGDGTAHWDDFEEHSSNPIEREAAEFFDSIIGKYIKTFYPQSTLTIRKVDAYKE